MLRFYNQIRTCFLFDLEKMGNQSEPVTVVTDGAYSGAANEKLALENNITLISTNLTGRVTSEILADFEFNDDGTKLLKCAGGYEPKSCSFSVQTGQCVASFHRSQCEHCPHKDQCNPKMFKRVSRKSVSVKYSHRAEQQRYRSSEEFKKMSSLMESFMNWLSL